MTPKRKLFFGGFGTLGLVLLAAVLMFVARAETSDAQVGNTTTIVNQYAAKFLCGEIPSPASPSQILAPGVYNTAVNIHNPNNFDVTIQKKAVISAIEPQQGLPGQRATHTLKPDASMEVDCHEIVNLLANATPACTAPVPPVSPLFCKGYLVTEAARQVFDDGKVKYRPAQLDVTDIITVKEEDGIWKDYTFQLRCLQAGGCQPIKDINTGVVYRYDSPYNWPDRPVKPPCYNNQTQICDIYDVDTLIRQRLNTACGGCGFPLQSTIIAVDLRFVNFATDSRDVTLDFEFVSPKFVTYPCWPKGTTACA